jgi:hypothetical protein
MQTAPQKPASTSAMISVAGTFALDLHQQLDLKQL